MSTKLKVLDAKKELAQHKIKDGETLTTQAQSKVNYQLIDDASGFGPQNIITKRIGNNLNILLENGDDQADIIIENYYDDEGATNLVVGEHENGNIYAYVPESSNTADTISLLTEQMAAPQALGGDEISGLWVFNP